MIKEKFFKSGRKCLTPESMYQINISPKSVSVKIDLPFDLPQMSEKEAELLENKLHDALEQIMSNYF